MTTYLDRWLPAPLRDELAKHDRHRTTVIVLLSAPVILTLRQYIITSSGVAGLLRAAGVQVDGSDRLVDLMCWTLGQFVCYFLLPVLIVKLVVREPLTDYGLKLSGLTNYWKIYAVMYALMLPLILLLATTREFQHTYPFYDPPREEPLWPRFWIWQVMYWAQFVSLEFFFRGYLIHGLRRELHTHAILVSTIPYCMIHYGKPLPETLGSIVAGVLLGTLSYTTRSVWLGAALHIAVAVTMDLAALWNEGRL